MFSAHFKFLLICTPRFLPKSALFQFTQQIFIEGLLCASHCGYWGHHSELDGLAALKEITFHSRLHRVKDKCMPGSDVSVNCKR